MERKVRGSVLTAYLDFIRMKWGKLALQGCLDDIDFNENITPAQYYDDTVRENILKWIGKEKGIESTKEVGKYVVKNLGLLAWIVRFANPKILAKKFPDNYREVYSFGRVEVDTEEDNLIILRLYDVNPVKESCMSWHGVCEGALELTRTVGEVTKHSCQLDGAPCCEYRIKYR